MAPMKVKFDATFVSFKEPVLNTLIIYLFAIVYNEYFNLFVKYCESVTSGFITYVNMVKNNNLIIIIF